MKKSSKARGEDKGIHLVSQGGFQMHFNDNELASRLFGPHDSHLKKMENLLDVQVHARGGQVSIQGKKENVEVAETVLNQLYSLMEKGYPVMGHDVEQAIRIVLEDGNAKIQDVFLDSIFIPSRNKVVYPRTIGQKKYLDAIRKNAMVFGVGPAGTGKTYLAIAMAAVALLKGEVKRIILTRPAIEAGEKLGFLPGNLEEKINPYLRPLFDSLNDLFDTEKTQRMLERGEVEVAPLAFMRGRTLNDAFVILDEAQNCTKEQMKMFLTRLGMHSLAVITGDVSQVDLPHGVVSGLIHALSIIQNIPGIVTHYFSDRDVVRHPLVQSIIDAYNKAEAGGRP